MNKSNAEFHIMRAGQKCRLDLNTMLFLPINVYWKNAEGFALGCNDPCAAACQANTRQELVGAASEDYLPSSLARLIDEVDRLVMTSGSEKSMVEYSLNNDGSYSSWLSTKQPMFNQKGEIVGLFGTATELQNAALSETTRMIRRLGIDVHELTFIHNLHTPQMRKALGSLTPKQSEYLHYLLQGEPDKTIADNMDIKVRTAHSHMNSVKEKLGCRSRDEVIARVLNPISAEKNNLQGTKQIK